MSPKLNEYILMSTQSLSVCFFEQPFSAFQYYYKEKGKNRKGKKKERKRAQHREPTFALLTIITVISLN